MYSRLFLLFVIVGAVRGAAVLPPGTLPEAKRMVNHAFLPYDLTGEWLPLTKAPYVATGLSGFLNMRKIYLDDRRGHVVVVTRDPVFKEVVVSFRGPSSVRNIISELSYDMVPYDTNNPSKGSVTRQIRDNTFQFIGTINSIISQERRAGDKLFIVGHSVGGSQALIGALWLTEQRNVIDGIYTFGASPVGDQTFLNYFSSFKLNEIHRRFTNYNDPLVSIPKCIVNNNAQYASLIHSPREYFFGVPNASGVQSLVACSATIQDPNCSIRYCPITVLDDLNRVQGWVDIHMSYKLLVNSLA